MLSSTRRMKVQCIEIMILYIGTKAMLFQLETLMFRK